MERRFETLSLALRGLSAVVRNGRIPHAVLMFFDVGMRVRIVVPIMAMLQGPSSKCRGQFRPRRFCFHVSI
jgi:hypothetical protein